ncbi:24924_t:CDS:2 [Entrophospora sp. SA101]|nr:24924_t:CDS:2 [Entrophospora sp. SA101]
MPCNNNTLEVSANGEYAGGSVAETRLKAALKAIPAANKIRTDLTSEQARDWLNKLHELKGNVLVSAANGGSNAPAISHTAPGGVPHANNDDLRNAGDITFDGGGGNNQRAMQVAANVAPNNTALRGSYCITVCNNTGAGAVANANLVTPIANNKYNLVQTTVYTILQTGVGGGAAISAGSLRTQEIGAAGGVTAAHIKKAKEFDSALAKLRKASGAGTKTNTAINSSTGAVVNAVEN